MPIPIENVSGLRFLVPTYGGHLSNENDRTLLPEAGPLHTLTLHGERGLRVLLGESAGADVYIERRPHGWALFVHLQDDPSCHIYITDDRRCYVLPEVIMGAQIVAEIPHDLDHAPRDDNLAAQHGVVIKGK